MCWRPGRRATLEERLERGNGQTVTAPDPSRGDEVDVVSDGEWLLLNAPGPEAAAGAAPKTIRSGKPRRLPAFRRLRNEGMRLAGSVVRRVGPRSRR